MTRKHTVDSIIAALILALVLFIPIFSKYLSRASLFYFEIKMQSSENGWAQIFFDLGDGFREADSARLPIKETLEAVPYRFPIPKGHYRALRLDPIDKEATVIFAGAKILDFRENVIKSFSAYQFRAVQQVSSLKVEGESVQMITIAGAYDPILELTLDGPFSLKNINGDILFETGSTFFILFIVCLGLVWLGERFYFRHREIVNGAWGKIMVASYNHPKWFITGIAIFAVILSCYPVVFFGKSFVSPNNAVHLLYETFPTLPGYEEVSLEDAKGSDVGAMMWGHLPYSVIQSRAILEDFELPLWNRFNSNGVTLIGQGQSMLGDPVHIIVILARGASWAWDIKYLLAKSFFTTGLGMTVYAATRHLPSSLVLAFSSAFIGFFPLRFNHPAFFSMCYAPWILYFWLGITQTPAAKPFAFSTVGLILANWMVMNSGTVKEAYMLLISLNLCGLILFLLAVEKKQLKSRKFFYLAWAGLSFILMSTPVWLTFLESLKQSYTSYDLPSVNQTKPFLFIGLFDDIFYRQLIPGEGHFNPSANFLIFLGFIWSLSRIKQMISNLTYLSIGASAAIAYSLVFGVIPANAITKIPFLANVVHVNNTFSCVLIIHLIILAGFGFKVCWEAFLYRNWAMDFAITILFFVSFLALYFGSTQDFGKSAFFYEYVFSLIFAFAALPIFAKRIVLRNGAFGANFILIIVCLIGLHWRHGMHLNIGFDKYVMNPQVRVDLLAKSEAVEFIKSESIQPFRAVGFGSNLFPGYNAALGIESIYGPDALINKYYRELIKIFPMEWEWDWRIIIRENTFSKLKPLGDFLNIKYYLASRTENPKEISGLKLTKSLDLNVYESKTAWPRAFFTDAISLYKIPSEFVNMLKDGDGRPFAAMQVNDFQLNTQLKKLLRKPNMRKVIPGTDYKLTNNTTSFKIFAPSSGLVVLTEAYLNEDFRVTVNGKPAKYFRVNHAFRGVEVPAAGIYSIAFSYWPKYFTLSLWMSAIGLTLLLFSAWHFLTGIPRNRMP